MTEHACVAAPPTPPLETSIRLRRGRPARKVSLTVTLRARDAPGDAVRRVVEVFSRFVEMACEGAIAPKLGVPRRQDHTDSGLVIETWEATFPKMAPEDFAVLERLVRCSVPGGARLDLVERAPEHTLLVRTLGREDEATLLELPWELAFTAASEPGVLVTFAEPATDATAALAGAAFRAWADVLELGGFPGTEGRLGSGGRLLAVETAGTHGLRARLERVICGHGAWEALFQVLHRVHEAAVISRVEIEGRAPEAWLRMAPPAGETAPGGLS